MFRYVRFALTPVELFYPSQLLQSVELFITVGDIHTGSTYGVPAYCSRCAHVSFFLHPFRARRQWVQFPEKERKILRVWQSQFTQSKAIARGTPFTLSDLYLDPSRLSIITR